jgi:AcrR family transcriptional regulator
VKRKAQVVLGAVLAAIAGEAVTDDLETAVLDATEALLRTSGLRRWAIEDVADRAGVGRATVYRRFRTRDDLVHAVLARELRRTLDTIHAAAARATTVESRVVAAVVTAVEALDGSVVDSLLRSDPATFLPFLTTEAGPLIAIAREAIVAQVAATGARPSHELAEAVARLGLSFVLTRDTVLPLADRKALERSVRRTVRPFLRTAAPA